MKTSINKASQKKLNIPASSDPITACDHLIDLPAVKNAFPDKQGEVAKNNQPKGEIRMLSKFFHKNGLYNLL